MDKNLDPQNKNPGRALDLESTLEGQVEKNQDVEEAALDLSVHEAIEDNIEEEQVETDISFTSKRKQKREKINAALAKKREKNVTNPIKNRTNQKKRPLRVPKVPRSADNQDSQKFQEKSASSDEASLDKTVSTNFKGNGEHSKAKPKKWISLIVLIFPVLLVTIDGTVMLYAMPSITSALQPNASEQLWMIDIYAFILAGLLITMGSLGDRVGRKKLLMIGTLGFGVASIFAANASTPMMMIIARGLLGIAGATLMPSTLALIRSIFHDPVQRRAAISIWSSAAAGGAALGPVLGGVLLEFFSWPAVFLINIPIIILFLIFGSNILVESKDPNPGPFDMVSVLLLLGGLIPSVYAIKTLASEGISWSFGISLAIGVLCSIVFIRRQTRLKDPLVDVNLFKSKIFSGGVIINLLSVFVLIGTIYIATQHLQYIWDKSPLEAALWLLPGASVGAVSSLLAIWVSRILPLNKAVSIGLLLMGAGAGVVFFSGVETNSVVLLLGITLVAGGSGVAYALANDAIIASVNPHKSGAAAGIAETAYELGGALGIAILGSFVSAFYRHFLQLPSGFTDGLAEEKVQESLGNAVAEVTKDPDLHGSSLGQQVVEAAKSAFTSAEAAVGVFVVIVALLGAYIAYKFLRLSKEQMTEAEH